MDICQRKTLKILTEWIVFRADAISSNEPFFTSRLGKKLSPQSVRWLVRDVVTDLGIKKHITPHTFRHTFATLLLEEDVDITYIQQLLGHSSIVTTQIYTHVNLQKQHEILSKKHPRRLIWVQPLWFTPLRFLSDFSYYTALHIAYIIAFRYPCFGEGTRIIM